MRRKVRKVVWSCIMNVILFYSVDKSGESGLKLALAVKNQGI